MERIQQYVGERTPPLWWKDHTMILYPAVGCPLSVAFVLAFTPLAEQNGIAPLVIWILGAVLICFSFAPPFLWAPWMVGVSDEALFYKLSLRQRRKIPWLRVLSVQIDGNVYFNLRIRTTGNHSILISTGCRAFVREVERRRLSTGQLRLPRETRQGVQSDTLTDQGLASGGVEWRWRKGAFLAFISAVLVVVLFAVWFSSLIVADISSLLLTVLIFVAVWFAVTFPLFGMLVIVKVGFSAEGVILKYLFRAVKLNAQDVERLEVTPSFEDAGYAKGRRVTLPISLRIWPKGRERPLRISGLPTSFMREIAHALEPDTHPSRLRADDS